MISEYSTENCEMIIFQNCKGKGKRVLTQIELRQYGIEVSEPVCKPKNGKRKFQVERFPGDIDYDYDDGKKIIG